MLYADYGYYKNEYHGKLDVESFNAQIVKASKTIDNNINSVLTETSITKLSEEAQDKLKYTACALTDLMFQKESFSGKLSSVSIDGVSKTYKSFTSNEFSESKKEILLSLPDELTCYR